MTDQKRRIVFATITGTFAAFSLAFLVITLLSVNLPNVMTALIYGCGAGLSALICVHLIWRRAMLKKETRTRGFWFGVLTGFTSLALMSVILTAGFMVPEMLNAARPVEAMIIGPIILMVVAFVLGGFLCLPAGGLLGWAFSRNPEDQTPANPNPK